MKSIRRWAPEVLFLLSFSLPFLKWANVDKGRRLLETYYGLPF